MKNTLLLRALNQEKVERPPVWMMRQAGRYLPEYIDLRKKYGFFERCQTPELACEITLQPIRRLGVDAAILFSDILVVPQAMGLEVQLIEQKGPFLPDPIKHGEDLKRLNVPDVHDALHYVMDAIKLIQQELNGSVPLIGFAGAPWTILCYMVEGQGSKTFDKARSFCYTQPATAHQLLDLITQTTIAYLNAQIDAGVDAVQIFDSWAGMWGAEEYQEFGLVYIEKIVNALQQRVPVIVFAKGAYASIEKLATLPVNALGMDWTITPEEARRRTGGKITLQGNLDPAKLLAPIPEIVKSTKEMVQRFGQQNYIANLGHGILPHVPVDHAKAFVDTIQSL